MSGMKPVSSLRVQLGKSRVAAAFILCACAATASVIAWVPSEIESPYVLVARSVAIIAVGLWALREIRYCAWLAMPRSIVALEIRGDCSITLIEASTARIEAVVQPQSFVSAWITTVVARASDDHHRRAIAILPDMLSAEDFRRVRVLLRLGDG